MAGAKITVGDLEIEAIEKVVVHVENIWGGIVGVALKEPVAVIFRSPAGTWRVDLEPRSQAKPSTTLAPMTED